MTISIGIHLPYGWAKSRGMRWFHSHAYGNVTANKAWEWQTDYFGWNTLFSLDLDLIPTGHDHAGIGFSLTILGFMVDAKIYDVRHWNNEAGTWEGYDEESMKARMSRDEEERAADLERAYMLVNEDRKILTKQNAIDYLETPQGQALIEQRAKAKLAEQQKSKEAKRARGEEYRRANAKGNDQ